jgi:hypothetical protein
MIPGPLNALNPQINPGASRGGSVIMRLMPGVKCPPETSPHKNKGRTQPAFARSRTRLPLRRYAEVIEEEQ